MRPKIEEFQNYLSRIFPDENYHGKMAKTITIQVTDACNLRCSYCYQIDKQNHVIPVETAIKFLEHLLTGDNDYVNPDNCSGLILEFIGGEPFMAIDVMHEVTHWFIGRMIELNHPWLHRFRISISSNGTLYFDPKVQRYLQEFQRYLSLSISLDGNRRLHDACRVYPDGSGSYDQAEAAVKDWMSRRYDMGSKMTLAPGNVAYTAEALQNLISMGYRSIFCNCVFEEGWKIEHATTLYHQLVEMTDWLEEKQLLDDVYISIFEDNFFGPKKHNEDENWCGGTGNMIAVDYKGDIFPCLRYMESSLGTDIPPMKIGTVADGIVATSEQQQTVKCLKCVTWRSQLSDECASCPISNGCAWCSAYNYQKLGNVNRRATFICEMHKARALANVYFWVKYNSYMGIKTPVINNVPRAWAVPIVGDAEYDALVKLTNPDWEV